ncbi:jg20754 [Pararge aegeria aegeria]|uniref:Jg20754 protein n=1 Tax=Pararge aegeria aegeria TaxID=348720 RepID=A0A8S4R1Q1_9NEOP|nr:jg20754 [Pararge aegeria aegeria]
MISKARKGYSRNTKILKVENTVWWHQCRAMKQIRTQLSPPLRFTQMSYEATRRIAKSEQRPLCYYYHLVRSPTRVASGVVVKGKTSRWKMPSCQR